MAVSQTEIFFTAIEELLQQLQASHTRTVTKAMRKQARELEALLHEIY